MKLYSIIILSSLFLHSYSQEFDLGYDLGYGSYSMSEVKAFHISIKDRIPFETKTTHFFPNFYNHNVFAIYYYKFLGLGLSYSKYSTGSRISRIDYSGEYKFDLKINSDSPGLKVNFKLFKPLFFEVIQYNTLEIPKTKVYMEELIQILDKEDEIYKFEYNSKNIHWEPGIKINIPIRFIGLGVFAGYDIALKTGEVKSKESKYIAPEIKEIDWSGWRIGASLSINFSLLYLKE